MATLDREGDAVVVRIVYDGPPTSGKTTSLRALAERFGQRALYTPEEARGRTLYFDWLEYRGGRFDGRPIHCQIVSVPGQKALASRRQLLLESADAVVFVADTSRAGMPDSLAHLADLRARLSALPGVPVGVVLQANKRDRADAGPLDALRGTASVAVIESVASAGEGIREAFVFAVRLALDRVRELIRTQALEVGGPGTDPAAALLERMRGLPVGLGADAIWTFEGAVERLPSTSPHTPDVSVPGGWIWPPVQGRVLLQEATRGRVPDARQTSTGEWTTDSSTGWRFHSAPSHVFADSETARAALIHWAQRHAAVAPWLSPNRCIALCETGDGGLRLWQAVRREPSLRAQLLEALGSPGRHRLAEALSLCERGAARWAQAPRELPGTLESVGAQESSGGVAFIDLMPAAPAERSEPPRLREEIDGLMRGQPGQSAPRLAQLR